MRSRRDQALALARLGLNIFPLPPLSKEPIADISWSSMMTTDTDQINEWFDAEPDMNYGVNGGDKFAIVDLDEKNGKEGITRFTELNMEQSTDDWCLDTFSVRTPSGGLHLYLRVPYAVANSASKIGAGIDIRGARGYVVGPGCLTVERIDERGKVKQYAGNYEIEQERELAHAPVWLLNNMLQHHERTAESETPLIELDLPVNVTLGRELLATYAPAIEGAGGDEHTYKLCAKLKDLGLSEEMAFSLLIEPGGWNMRCLPPWQPHDLATKVKNAFSYGQNSGGVKGDLWDAPGAFTPEEYLAGLAEQKEAARVGLAEHLFDAESIANSHEHREMVIPEWLPATGYTAFLARRGTGKTVQMMDMACRIACDMDWHDMPIMEDFAIIYVCGEDDIGAKDQLRAWMKKHGEVPPKDRFFFMDTTFDLMSRDSVESWVTFLREQLKGRRAVVFVDTWQRATSRGAQNEDTDMQLAVHHAEAVARSFRGPAVIAFHPPKADANVVLGSSVIENASTAIWSLTEEGGGRTLSVQRIKGKGFGNFQQFRYDEVPLNSLDYFGREITGIVPTRTGGTTTKGTKEETDREDTAQMMYADLIRSLINDETKKVGGALPATAFTLKDTARRIMATPKGYEQRVSLEQIAEERLPNETAVLRRLTYLFKDKKPYFDFGDKGTLYLDTASQRPRFILKASEAKPQDDELQV